MTIDPAQKVRQELRRLGISCEWVEIDPEYADTAAFCEKYGYPIDYCGNTIIIASKKEPKRYSACIVKGSMRLDVNNKVSQLMGVKKLSFASADETMALTQMLIGGVTPFGLPDDLPIYVDDQLKGVEYVILGSGSRSSKVKMSPSELGKIPNVQFIQDLSMPPRV